MKKKKARELKKIFTSSSISPKQYSFSPRNLHLSSSSAYIKMPQLKEYGSTKVSPMSKDKLKVSLINDHRNLALKLKNLKTFKDFNKYSFQKNTFSGGDKSTSSGLNNSTKYNQKEKKPENKILNKLLEFKSFSSNLSTIQPQRTREKSRIINIINQQQARNNEVSTIIQNLKGKKNKSFNLLPSISSPMIVARARKEKIESDDSNKFVSEAGTKEITCLMKGKLMAKVEKMVNRRVDKAYEVANKKAAESKKNQKEPETAADELIKLENFIIKSCVNEEEGTMKIISDTALLQYFDSILVGDPPGGVDMPFILYYIKKYFDCYSELITRVTGEKDIHYSNDVLLDRYDIIEKLKGEDGKKKRNKKKGDEFDLINQNYVAHFIQNENRNFSSPDLFTQYGDDSVSVHSLSKNKSTKFRSTVRLKKDFEISQPVSTLKFALTQRKVDKFAFVRNKYIFSRKEERNTKIYKSFFHAKSFKQSKKCFGFDGKKSIQTDIFVSNLYSNLYSFLNKNSSKDFIACYKQFHKLLDLNKADENGNTFLILAAKNGCTEIAEFLLAEGCNPDYQNNLGSTAFHYAVSYKNYEIINILVKYKANEHLRNAKGLIPWECNGVNCDE